MTTTQAAGLGVRFLEATARNNSNGTPVNITDGLFEIAEAILELSRQVNYLGTGNANSGMGAIEYLATELRDGTTRIAEAMEKDEPA